jgi:hypothetical protein
MRIFHFVLLLTLCSATAAFAEDQCPPLKLVTRLDMTMGQDGRPYIPVKINGTPETMLIDTGGVFTEIPESVRDALQLEKRNVPVEMVGVTGSTTHIAARGSFGLGNLTVDKTDFMVMPDTKDAGDGASGIFAPNFLHAYDADFDFGGKTFSLISQDHCDGKVVYWPAQSVAVVPMRVDKVGHIHLTVTVEGKQMSAMLDTGASNTFADLSDVVTRFGLTAGAADTPYGGELGPTHAAYYSHHFKSLSLEGIAISNANVKLIPDLMRRSTTERSSTLEGGSRIPDRDLELGLSEITLGMDILRHFHLYIAYKEQKLYITPATVPTPASSAAAEATGQAVH